MTDREMLELAAKAAEITGYRYSESFQSMANWNESDGGWFDAYCLWNPLEDDGDAMRLAVKLGFVVEPGKCWHSHYGPAFGEDVLMGVMAAARRAIVRAAAEIGAQM